MFNHIFLQIWRNFKTNTNILKFAGVGGSFPVQYEIKWLYSRMHYCLNQQELSAFCTIRLWVTFELSNITVQYHFSVQYKIWSTLNPTIWCSDSFAVQYSFIWANHVTAMQQFDRLYLFRCIIIIGYLTVFCTIRDYIGRVPSSKKCHIGRGDSRVQYDIFYCWVRVQYNPYCTENCQMTFLLFIIH